MRSVLVSCCISSISSFFNIPQHVLRASDPWRATGMFQDDKAVDLGSLLGMPPTITAKLLRLFTENEKGTLENTWCRHRSHEHINLLISYILVLGLKTDSFEMEPCDLAVELKMTISQNFTFWNWVPSLKL
ncbi:hypothetical protein O6H91_06G081000 [Diphasiastrum complanatum]|uniref:Uncharacterized protein n=2 Tax=Diphasiastrum complanatum TaxID=34168 RepID=A0ACC2DES1_DIPCM|nr:hypothetical protein O6H91_06G068100 [Diphasiastrum complanatum]KAJ7553014.1 hypothetical protein O6H91_06G081000 [Diphasiastrum complanatum]